MQLCPECTGPLFLAPPASRVLVGVTPRGGMWFRGSVLATTLGFDFVFVYWHLILVTPDGPHLWSTLLPRLSLAMVDSF